MRRRTIGLLAVLALVFAACSESTGSNDTTAATAGGTVGAGGGDAVNGELLYNGTCIACHGPNGEGIEGLGKPWVGSEFINGSTDAEMFAFLEVGRPSDDPLNTTGIAMLPRGGNPALSDDDLFDLIAYMRTLNT